MNTLLVKNNQIHRLSPLKSRQRGYNLIEVMVAALILSTALLGIAGLQMIGTKGTQQSLMKQQAMGVVQTIIERMRANQAGVIAGDYALSSTGFNCGQALPNCSTMDCTSAQIALVDKLNVVCGVQAGGGPKTGGVKTASASDNAILVNGKLDIVCRDCTLGDVTVTVGWKEREFGQEAASPDETLIINTRVVTTP